MKKLLSALIILSTLLITTKCWAGNIGGSTIGSQVSFIGQPEISGVTVTGTDVYATNLFVGGAPVIPGDFVPFVGADKTINLNSQHLLTGPSEIDGQLDMYGDIDLNFKDITSVDRITANDFVGAYLLSSGTGMGVDMTGDPWYFSESIDLAYNSITCGPLYSDHQHSYYATGVQLGQVANLLGTHQHSTYLTDAPSDGNTYGRNNAAWAIAGGGIGGHLHPYYTPLADYSIHTHPNYATGISLGTVAGLLGTHQHNVSYPTVGSFQALSSIATTNQHTGTYPSAAAFQALSQIATTNIHANYEANIQSALSQIGTNTHPNYATGTSLGTVANNLGTHTHPNYQTLGSYASSSHVHSNYEANIVSVFGIATTNQHAGAYVTPTSLGTVANLLGTHTHPSYEALMQSTLSLASTNTHAVASTTATGFAPIRSGVVTEFLNGTGAYSTPAGGPGGGGTTHAITQVAHGFSVGNVIKFSGGIYAKAQADSAANAEVIGLVSAIAGADDFTFISGGYHGTLSGKTAGSVYYLDPSTAGALTTTEPSTVGQISKPVIIATSASDGFFYNFRGTQIQASSGGGVDSFETLASPQALQGIEQLRHGVTSYQNYGNVIVDGLQDQTGISGTHQVAYTGSSSYQYSLSISSSQYPPVFDTTYIKATTNYGANYREWFTADNTKSLIGPLEGNQWDTAAGLQRFHIDLGSAKIIGKIYYENGHISGGTTNMGMKNFTFWGSNAAGDFADLVYVNDGTWVALATSQSTLDEHIASNIPDPKYITVTNTTAYRYYAFKFVDNWGAAIDFGVRRIELQTPVATNGFIHTIAYPMPTVPTHLGVSVKLDSAFTSNQHQYLKVDISRDGGTTFTDCHPITKIGTAGYYRADMETITSQPSGSTALAKISLTHSTTKALKGLSIYGE
ncbi:MAG: hypothetical protein V1709_04340 [Planctomycetota bacterium]